MLCACNTARLHYTFWIIVEGISCWKLGAPKLSFRLRPRDIKLCVLHAILKSLVILVTLILILFLFSYFGQTNHWSEISVVWDVTLCRVCDSRRFRTSLHDLQGTVSPKQAIVPPLPMTALRSVPHKYDTLPCHRRSAFSPVLLWETQI
jgi:hypothetical protein